MTYRKPVTAYTAEVIRPGCIQLRNRGAIIAHIHYQGEGHVTPGWKVIPNQSGRRPSRGSYATAALAAEKFFDKSAAQAVAAVEQTNGHDEPETVIS
jgi:hypothetical protein